MVLEEDGYRPVTRESDVERGDVVVYSDDREEVQHVGIVLEVFRDVRPDTTEPWKVRVLSKWGADGEYIHWANDVVRHFGRPHYFTERSVL
jgi:hypothetical protein